MAFAFINPQLIFPQQTFTNQTAALNFLAGQLTKQGYAKSSFKSAVLAREETYPTGLPTGVIQVAIPHADWQNVQHSGIAMTTLTTPVAFSNMADPSETLAVSMIFMLAIDEPHGQVRLLKELMQIVQDQSHLQQLLAYATTDQLYSDLKNTFATLKL